MMHDADMIHAIFGPDGSLAARNNFEYRPQQETMARAIMAALSSRSHLIVEAPTGIGKSLAYLIPALLFAAREKRKAIVSTHTKNLQEQLLKKDLAIVQELLDLPFRPVVFKGRKNYLCTTRLANAMRLQRQLFDEEEFHQLRRINEWSRHTTDGDVENFPFTPSANVWNQVCSEKGACSSRICKSGCFFQQARAQARQADLVIMNHALFFTLFATQPSEEFFLFKDDFVIFDEAHTLEQVAGTSVGNSIARSQILFAIHRLFNPKTGKGLLARIREKHCRSLCEEAERAAVSFFADVEHAVRNLGMKAHTLRIRTPYFVDDTLTHPLRELQSAVKELEENKKVKVNNDELVAAKHLVREAEVRLQEFLRQPDASMTYWVELSTGRFANVVLHAAPTSVAASLGPRLFKKGTSVIMTSATLAIDGSLAYFQQRLGGQEAETLLLDSPFDFQRQMRIVIVKDLPRPDNDGYEGALPAWVYRSIARTRGKALVLFTSSALMHRTAEALRERLTADGISLLVQDATTTRHRLLEQFRRDIHSVLFGLDSYWMGIDVPGEALEHVIITRLPFAVPGHPLVESRMEQIAQSGGNSFLDYTLPEAVLKFKQGVGRLIRSRTDRGLITILDSRILTGTYGRAFLQSIPRCPVEILSADGNSEEIDYLNV